MKIELPFKALSSNNAWQGRRFKSVQYCDFEQDCFKLIKGEQVKGEVEIYYKFFYKTRQLDIDNPIKPLQDILVKCKMIEDDRKVRKIMVEKFDAEEDRIEIIIEKYQGLLKSL